MEPENQNQVDLLSLPAYQRPPLRDFAAVGPDSDLTTLNLNWRESDLPEHERTKHVHRLHPYLGKFIPQLAEVFLRKYAPAAVFDPFAGSGTTLVEANQLGCAAYGCDVSAFNCLLAEVKTGSYDLTLFDHEVGEILLRALLAEGDRAVEENEYLRDWYAPEARRALVAYRDLIPQYKNQKALAVILSRAARSARLARHFDLDFPQQPQCEPYFCHKHRRVCRPTRDAAGFLKRYSFDTIARLRQFASLRTDAPVRVVHGDAREIELPPVDLVLTSPPYVGLIDYHEQHRYAYELLSLPRHDDREIGAAARGATKEAQRRYREEICAVFRRAASLLRPDGRMVIVVGDRHGLYRGMAGELGLWEEYSLERHVNRRTGRRQGQFFENILVWRKG